MAITLRSPAVAAFNGGCHIPAISFSVPRVVLNASYATPSRSVATDGEVDGCGVSPSPDTGIGADLDDMGCGTLTEASVLSRVSRNKLRITIVETGYKLGALDMRGE